MIIAEGTVTLTEGPGLGIDPDFYSMKAYRAV
jgi:hypothetical protein